MTTGPIALVLPGRGYGHDHPGLYYTRMALLHRGWRVHPLVWQGLPDDPEQWPDHVMNAAAAAVEEVQPQLVVGKSLGSLAIPLAADRGLPGVWLTPLFFHGPTAQAAQRLPAESLMVGGTADESWDSDLARSGADRCGYQVLELPGADHGFDTGGDPTASIAALDRLASAVLSMLDQLAR